MGMQKGVAALEDSIIVSYKLSTLLPCDPAIMRLGIYTNELKPYVHTKPCTQMIIATVFIIVKAWKQLRCPSAGKWINCGPSRQWNILH